MVVMVVKVVKVGERGEQIFYQAFSSKNVHKGEQFKAIDWKKIYSNGNKYNLPFRFYPT